jgi:uncharacterized protein (TIGR03083 family)
MHKPGSILIVDRFGPLLTQLLELLADLSDEDWRRPTGAPAWSVKDLAAHLLGGDVSILSGWRDGSRSSPPIQSNADLITLVDRLNAEWVQAARRISPRLLCELLAFTGPQVEKCFAAVDPMAIGGAVSWAGPEPAPRWFGSRPRIY